MYTRALYPQNCILYIAEKGGILVLRICILYINLQSYCQYIVKWNLYFVYWMVIFGYNGALKSSILVWQTPRYRALILYSPECLMSVCRWFPAYCLCLWRENTVASSPNNTRWQQCMPSKHHLALYWFSYECAQPYDPTWSQCVTCKSLWRNRLARSAVNRKVGGSSPPRDGEAFCLGKKFQGSRPVMPRIFPSTAIVTVGVSRTKNTKTVHFPFLMSVLLHVHSFTKGVAFALDGSVERMYCSFRRKLPIYR